MGNQDNDESKGRFIHRRGSNRFISGIGQPSRLQVLADYGRLVAGGALAAALFLLEMVQRYLPGRTPEITDALIAVAMTAALWAVRERREHGQERVIAHDV